MEAAIVGFVEQNMIQSADCLQREGEATSNVQGLVCPIHYRRVGTRFLVTNVVARNLQPEADSWRCKTALSSSKGVEHMSHVRNKRVTVEDGDYNSLRYNPTAASLQWDWQYCEGVS
jgi:hypothetical protein